MGELALGVAVAALACVTWWLARNRDTRAIVHWTRGWFFLFASGALLVVLGGDLWADRVVHLLGPFFPFLMLAGALVHAGQRVPVWLLPLAFVLGTARLGLDVVGNESVDHGLALVFEPGALLAAAFFAFRAAREAPCRARRRLLAPAFVAVAAVETATSIWGMSGPGIASSHLLAWTVVAPATVLVQIGVTREYIVGWQRRAQQALSDSEQRFRALTDNAFDLIAEMDPKGRFTYANPRCEEWFGVVVSELTGTFARELVHPDDRARTLAWFAEQGSEGNHSLLTIRSRHRDGSWRWLEISGRSFEVGGELRIVANCRDVTERIALDERLKGAHDRLEQRVERRNVQLQAAIANLEEEIAERRRIEYELRVSEERWRNVSELTSDLNFAVTREPDGSLTTDWVTHAIKRISGRDFQELQTFGWEAIIHPEDRDRVLAQLREIRHAETREFDSRVVARDGEVRSLRTRVTGSASPVDGKLRVLGASRDITEMVSAEEERRRLEAHMQEAQKLESLGVMAGGVAHDFNNVLAVILGNSGLALGEAPPESRLAKQLERIRSAARHAEALTSQMLTYSGKVSVSLKPLDLSWLIEEMSELLEAAISEQCRLDTSLAHGRTLVEGDPTQIQQVIMNLVSNASEALGDRSGQIAVRCGLMTADAAYLADTVGASELAEGEYVYVEVADPGQGIDAETRKRIFEPFFSTKFTGRGLGLASVLGIVRAHRGAIKLVTEPGAGTRFRVLLPPASVSALPERTRSHKRRPRMRGGTILVVDDDEAVLELAGEFLRRGGLQVVTAAGGRQALEFLRGDSQRRIDAVVLDLAMPDLDGRETLVEIQRLRPGLPVVVASGFGEEATAQSFPAADITAFVQKPYEPEVLIETVRAALGA